MDLELVAQTVAAILATGAVQGVGEDAARSAIGKLRDEVLRLFGKDRASVSALDRAQSKPDIPAARVDLVGALVSHGRQDRDACVRLEEWITTYVPNYGTPGHQHIHANRDAFVAGRDMSLKFERAEREE